MIVVDTGKATREEIRRALTVAGEFQLVLLACEVPGCEGIVGRMTWDEFGGAHYWCGGHQLRRKPRPAQRPRVRTSLPIEKKYERLEALSLRDEEEEEWERRHRLRWR